MDTHGKHGDHAHNSCEAEASRAIVSLVRYYTRGCRYHGTMQDGRPGQCLKSIDVWVFRIGRIPGVRH